ncbi:EAL domain-containing protein [Achromobacter pestifer]|uniref:EAL domain-containing protein n=1 Tax=Achromobacter pestifer TaxID=1353889 RepID=A0A7D4DXW6_9BURK|nr:EAL domain-containing protein [Achromobacter pestifer]QKH34654.1 EAL domain-containing protein [Achromobacter pestifer]
MNQHAAIDAFQALQDALSNALVHDELSLQYQPIVDRSRKSIGMEALMRWNSAEYGQIPPSEFVPLAERTGAIMGMGAWALEAGCQQLEQWTTNPMASEWTLSVNVSAHQFNQPDFAGDVLNLLKRYRIAPDRLILEVTESVFLNPKGSGQQGGFQRIRDAGVGIAVDDFGTGFSSIGYLKYLSISRIKIDKIFIDEIVVSKKDQGIVGAIVMLAQALEVDVVAEGVETAEQWAYLRNIGCSAFQGFLFGRPSEVSDFL